MFNKSNPAAQNRQPKAMYGAETLVSRSCWLKFRIERIRRHKACYVMAGTIRARSPSYRPGACTSHTNKTISPLRTWSDPPRYRQSNNRRTKAKIKQILKARSYMKFPRKHNLQNLKPDAIKHTYNNVVIPSKSYCYNQLLL